jgi:TrmH family RNA methyltransferase
MRKVRRETGLFVAEGASILVTARDAGWTPQTLVFLAGSAQSGMQRELLDWAERGGAECLEVSAAVLAKLAAKDNPQTMLGVFEQRWASEPNPAASSPRRVEDAPLARRRRPTQVSTSDQRSVVDSRLRGKDVPTDADVWLALEAVRDPGNLGTIIRTADAAGASGIILVGETTDPFSLETVRATMGSVFAVPVARATPEEFIAWRKSAGVSVVATHLAGAVDYRTIDYRKKPVVLLMGNEQSGLPEQLAKEADALARIPQQGRADSLNLAVATAVMLFEARRHLLSLAEGK